MKVSKDPLVVRPVAAVAKTTKGTNFAKINFEAPALNKESSGMPKNGSGDNLSTLSQSPPLVPDGDQLSDNKFKVEPEMTTLHQQTRAGRKIRQKKSITQMQIVFDPATQAQQAPLAKPNPYMRSKAAIADASGQRLNF